MTATDPGPPGLNNVVLPAENSGKISAARQFLTTSRYHSSRPGPPPQELLTTSGAKSTRAFPFASVGARIHCAAANKSASDPPLGCECFYCNPFRAGSNTNLIRPVRLASDHCASNMCTMPMVIIWGCPSCSCIEPVIIMVHLHRC